MTTCSESYGTQPQTSGKTIDVEVQTELPAIATPESIVILEGMTLPLTYEALAQRLQEKGLHYDELCIAF
jgi:hypothetical protein